MQVARHRTRTIDLPRSQGADFTSVTTLTALYLAAFCRRAALRRTQDGYEARRRIAALAQLPRQVCVMPSLWVASALVPGSASVLAAVFANVFGSMLLFDLCAIKYNAMMLAHHWLCLAGHCFAMSVAPEAFGRYFGAVVALELGSATSCSWWMWGGEWPRALDALYGGGMTLSNGLGAALLLRRSTLPARAAAGARGAGNV